MMKCVKEISCRVIRSVPFSKARGDSSSARRVGREQYESGRIAAATSKSRAIIDTVRDGDMLSIVFGGEFPRGQILDFYA
jgi:hypothetical protein